MNLTITCFIPYKKKVATLMTNEIVTSFVGLDCIHGLGVVARNEQGSIFFTGRDAGGAGLIGDPPRLTSPRFKICTNFRKS